MFSEEKKEHIIIAWENFKKGIYMDESYVRKEILESWLRSKNSGVGYDSANKDVMSKSELEERIKEKQELYDIATPFLYGLYEFTKGSSFMAILSDEEGYVLKTLGDNDIKVKTDENRLVEGCNRSEERLGTNAIGTCLYLKKPIQIWADEHYYIHHRDKTCSGAPIFGPNGKLIGSLCLTGTYDKAHFHTLGMVVSAADAISKQLGLKYTYDKMLEVKNKLNIIIETIPSGVILINEDLIITQVNSKALSLLQTNELNVIGQNICKFIKKEDINLKNLKKNIYDTDICIEINNQNKNFSMSAILIDKPKDNLGFVITFRKTETVHKMVNKIVGSRAPFVFEDIIGNSPQIMQSKRLAKIASENNATVLLRGDSGTGKELFAQSIHNLSAYKDGPFVAINCGSLPRTLIESELFGYVSGTFTGAKKEGQAGKFELANGGTIFLDEIGEMPADVQVSLLRVLQNREVMRIGGTKAVKIDVRIIAATNKNLEDAIADNTFRNDLYYRLNVFSIKIPPLNQREGDIRLLSDYFLNKYKSYSNKIIKGISNDVYKALENYNWPGNIRELENTIERAILICQNQTIELCDIPENIINFSKADIKADYILADKNMVLSEEQPLSLSMPDIEKNYIINALVKTNGNIKKAADFLDMNRRTLYRKLEKYDIDYEKIRNG